MKTIIATDYDQLCDNVADVVIRQLAQRPGSVLVFPTGNTPLGLYRRLVAAAGAGTVDFSQARVVALDEYAGLEPGDPRSLTDWLRRGLLDPVGVPPARVHGFEAGAEALEATITALGGLDLVILGLGLNGHLGFNEPGSAFDSRTRNITLTPASLRSNAAYWGSQRRVPRHGLTLGLGTIAAARAVVLMVSGAAKRTILSRTLAGAVSPDVPASLLTTLDHAVLHVDQAALAGANVAARPATGTAR